MYSPRVPPRLRSSLCSAHSKMIERALSAVGTLYNSCQQTTWSMTLWVTSWWALKVFYMDCDGVFCRNNLLPVALRKGTSVAPYYIHNIHMLHDNLTLSVKFILSFPSQHPSPDDALCTHVTKEVYYSISNERCRHRYTVWFLSTHWQQWGDSIDINTLIWCRL